MISQIRELFKELIGLLFCESDFVGEMISALSVADGAIILVDSVAGIEVGTELAWNYSEQFNLPRFFVINKMDLPDVQALLPEVIPYFDKLGLKVFPISAATGEGIPALLDEIAATIWTT